MKNRQRAIIEFVCANSVTQKLHDLHRLSNDVPPDGCQHGDVQHVHHAEDQQHDPELGAQQLEHVADARQGLFAADGYGLSMAALEDVNGDGDVNVSDLVEVILAWGSC